MGEITAVPLLGVIIALWGFLKFGPDHENQRGVYAFNGMVIGLGALLWLIGYYTMETQLALIGRSKYTLLLGLGVGGLLMIVYLGICYLIRNFWLFADQRRI